MPNLETAIFGGGCFWCLEAIFQRLPGVKSVESGYSGGHVEKPNYKQVCTGTTGHAEVVRVSFDPSETSYRELLAVFFATHDPTTLNRQGNDVGTQYRSAIFYHTEAQRATAQEVIRELTAEKAFRDQIVTEVRPASEFYIAEDYHQEYFANNPQQPYCAYVVAPKVQKFRKKFVDKVKSAS
jgi:peptide-methionine (S)-S-oxide reductase